jgi:IMP cyclohydrolase
MNALKASKRRLENIVPGECSEKLLNPYVEYSCSRNLYF